MSLAAPFPYFGGKRRAAEIVWGALGDPSGYVEPFAGSAAVLLARDLRGRRVETLNDADGWLVNAWRAIQHDPAAVAVAAYGPVTEIDYHARLAWLHERRTAELVQWLEGDPENHDPKAAGWWLYVLSCGIGDPFGGGPWRVIDGKLRDTRATQDRASIADSRELPHLGDAGKGVNRGLPHLVNAGKGVNRGLPHLVNAGKGVNRGLPHLVNAGKGVNRELPHLGDAGKGALTAYLERLAARLSRVRITCGSWERVVKPSVVRAGAGGDGTRAVFLDPPYTTSGDLYAHGCDTGAVSAAVQEWCREADPSLRIVLAGYDDEHDTLIERGWQRVAGKAGGGAGYSVRSDNGKREGLWLSPSCVSVSGQLGLLEAA
jgi:site-specific DNA-adenine methylase